VSLRFELALRHCPPLIARLRFGPFLFFLRTSSFCHAATPLDSRCSLCRRAISE
jgi:hypothetical protein